MSFLIRWLARMLRAWRGCGRGWRQMCSFRPAAWGLGGGAGGGCDRCAISGPRPGGLGGGGPEGSVQVKSGRYFATLLAIVVVNYLGASLGRLMAIPPGNVTPVWPPSGLALAALLILGPRYWPGVWLASFAFNLHFFDENIPELQWNSLVCSLAIASGSSLQAWLGAVGFRRITGFPGRPFQVWRFFRGLAVGGPLACLIAASFGASSICLTGAAPLSAFGNLWVTWWFGDTAGVMLVAGSILSAYLQARQKDQLDPAPDNRYLWHTFCFLVLLMALGGTLWGWAVLRARTFLDDRAHFDKLADQAEQGIRDRLTRHENVLYGAAGLVRTVPGLSRSQWLEYARTTQLETRYPGIWGLGLIEVVPPERLEKFVREARRTVTPDFQIKRAGPVTAGADAFVIRLIEPLERNRAALGLDIASEAERRRTAEEARAAGRSRVTGIIRLVQDEQRTAGCLLLVPVSDKEGFRGWVYAPFAGGSLFSDIVPQGRAELTFSVYDGHVSAKNRIFASGSPASQNPSRELRRFQTVEFGGRPWLVVFEPTADFRISPFASQASLLLVFGLALTSLLAALLVSLVSTRAQALNLAQSSMRALREGNDRLHRQNEELELARQEALTASRLKSEFLANTSHEIRTPLNGVLGMTQLLLGTALDEQQREFAQTVHKSADALMSVLNDILDLSKIEAGKLEIEVIPFDLTTALQELAELTAYRARQKQLEFHLEQSPEVPRWVEGDPGRLRQILLNLLTNAFKFTESGRVDLKVFPVANRDQVSTLKFIVQDTGKGIAADKLPLLFEKFVQEDNSTTRHFGGTGLGLAICKSLVHMMGGEIGAQSTPGTGSTFWFTVSLPVREAPEATEKVVLRRLDRPFRVLLAEDNVVNQKVAVHLLEKLGGQVDVVANGREALEMVQSFQYDLILMDCQMPEMDGYEATRQIRSQAVKLPIIALTANAMKGDSQRCLEAGMDDYLTKPITLDSLQAALVRWLPQD